MEKLQSSTGGQMSENFITAVFLTLSGGFQDAYTYCLRGEVFANGQTGNIVLMSSYLFKGDWLSALRYFIPICAFAAGIFLAETVRRRFKYLETLHWRQIILIAEILLLFTVGFMPVGLNNLANAVVSLVCAMQVQTFRKVDGRAYASTMCIGNLRSGVDALCAYLHTKERASLDSALEYFFVIFLFAVGAGLGSVFTGALGQYAIIISCALLMISFCIMFINGRDEKGKR